MSGNGKKQYEIAEEEESEDLDLEYYELREEAVKRVAIKRSVQIHAIVWLGVNLLLLIINLVITNFRPANLGEFWNFWTIFCWGFGLYAHATVWFTINIRALGRKLFVIHCFISIGLVPLLATLNLLIMPYYLWFLWVIVGEAALIFIHYYIVFISTGPTRLEKAIQHEMERLRSRGEKATRSESLPM